MMGASGSGKSSLIQAGVIPRLQDEWGTSELINVTFVPDKYPFASLLKNLPRKYEELAEPYLKKEEPKIPDIDALSQVVKIIKQDSQKVLIFIDQFEELFTRSQKAERNRFIENLVQLIGEKDSSVKVVMTIRTDFIGYLSHYPDFETDDYTCFLKELKPIELEEAIQEPAARNGVTFADDLVKQIIKDFSEQSGSLKIKVQLRA
jgi:hypothetical protein